MRRLKPIKPFKTLEEEAEFWDTHDVSAIFRNPKTPLTKLLRFESEKQEIMTLRLQKSVKSKLENIAHSMGMNPSTLARIWLIEKLQRIASS